MLPKRGAAILDPREAATAAPSAKVPTTVAVMGASRGVHGGGLVVRLPGFMMLVQRDPRWNQRGREKGNASLVAARPRCGLGVANSVPWREDRCVAAPSSFPGQSDCKNCGAVSTKRMVAWVELSRIVCTTRQFLSSDLDRPGTARFRSDKRLSLARMLQTDERHAVPPRTANPASGRNRVTSVIRW